MHGRKVLLVDDDAGLVRLLVRAFTKAGAQVHTAHDRQEVLRQFYAHQPDLVILNIAMPGLDGWQTISALRGFADVPIIFLSARSEEREIVRGLESGAVDYVTKPFSVDVLLARSRAALRRQSPPRPAAGPEPYDDGHLHIDLAGRRVSVRGKPLALSETEYRLLAQFFQHAGRVRTYDEILDAVWGPEYRDSPEYVHAYIWRLRQKIEPDPRDPVYLTTQRGAGYRFQMRTPEPSAWEVQALRTTPARGQASGTALSQPLPARP